MGGQVGAIAKQFGQPLMEWQQYVADVGLELREDGKPAYREIVVTVPRQNGKTTLVLAWELHRALMWGAPQLILYSAQTGADAREKFLKDQIPLIERCKLRAAIDKIERANGREGMLFRGGSRISIIASGASAGHGKTVGLGVVDEAFDDVDDRREQAFLPAMLTVSDAQMFVCSTMGTDASIYLNRKVEAGREFATLDSEDGDVAYFEWSALPDEDIDDPVTWQKCMPAYGRTIGAPAVKHARATMLEGDFRRAMLNQQTRSEERVIPQDAWDAVQAEVTADQQTVFAIDCNPERSMASIAAADSRGFCELGQHDRGTGWLIGRATELSRKWGASVAVDPAGPAGSFIPDLELAGINVVKVGGQDFTKACGAFYTSVMDGTVKVRPNNDLDVAVAAVKKRPVGDAWVWGRKTTTIDISPLVALSVACWAARGTGPAKFINLAEL